MLEAYEAMAAGEDRRAFWQKNKKQIIALDEDGLALLRGEKIGIVFQSFHLVPTMTALENVALPLEFQGRGEAFESARELLGEVGQEHRLHHFPAELSGGEQQRVAIARALSTRPRLILADEPTGQLDTVTGSNIIALLREIVDRTGITVIIASHDPKVEEAADRILELEDGKLVFE